MAGDGFSWSFSGKGLDPKKLGGVAFNTQIMKTSFKFEYADKAQIDAKRIATFSITHCSDYVLSKELIKNAIGNPKPANAAVPQTGCSYFRKIVLK